MQRLRGFLPALTGLAIFLFAGLVLVLPGQAAAPAAAPALQTTDDQPGVSNDACLACHSAPGQTYTMPNGDILDITINAGDYNNSVHGMGGYACVQCHGDIREYPHPELAVQSARQLTLQLNNRCNICHATYVTKQANSVHAQALSEGNQAAAVCTDCHGAHNTRRLNDPLTGELLPESRTWIPTTCAQCHNEIYQKYRQSVHGAALTDENNPDVPTCIDCHGVHDIEDPTTAAFRLNSPQVCAKCHTDEEKMADYGLSTHVLSSYVSDFHGTTVVLFEKQSPDQETNKAVCYDCHGIHDINRTKDPASGLRLQENLLKRCQECHPDATANFPTAWLSHYEPSPDRFPIVYYVNLFYKFFIPGVLGGMGVLVAMDLGKKIYDSNRKYFRPTKKPVPAPAPTVEPEAEPSQEESNE